MPLSLMKNFGQTHVKHHIYQKVGRRTVFLFHAYNTYISTPSQLMHCMATRFSQSHWTSSGRTILAGLLPHLLSLRPLEQIRCYWPWPSRRSRIWNGNLPQLSRGAEIRKLLFGNLPTPPCLHQVLQSRTALERLTHLSTVVKRIMPMRLTARNRRAQRKMI